MRTDSTDVNLDRCYGCGLHDSTDPIFDLCKHESSHYSIGGKVDFHTRAATTLCCFSRVNRNAPQKC